MAASVRVLLGDSSPSQLPATILDTLGEVCVYARDVSIAHEETTGLWAQLDAAEASFADISEQLQRFRRVGESGLLASVKDATRDEMKEHGQQAVDALGRQIDGWLAQYKNARDKHVGELRRKIEALHQQMLASLDRFALPLRAQPSERVVRRKFDEEKGRYRDIATLDVLPGLRAQLQLEDTETEQPRRLKTVLGKGLTLQVGTKKTLLRRTEEPAHISLDDLQVLAAQVTPEAIRLELGKKAAGPVTLRLGLGMSDGRLVGRGEIPDGGGNALPEEDRETMLKLWEAMQAEATRIVSSPARSLAYALRDEAVESPAGFVNVAERILEVYRPTIREIMVHSPNNEELTIKVEVGDRREEKWILRETLAEHMSKVPKTFAKRLAVPEVFDPPSVSAALPVIALPPDSQGDSLLDPNLDPSVPLVDLSLEEKATRAYPAIPEELMIEHTDDISLTDLEVEGEAGEIVDDVPPPPPEPAKPPPLPAAGPKEAAAATAESDGKSKLPRPKPKPDKPKGLPSVKKPPPPGGLRRPKS